MLTTSKRERSEWRRRAIGIRSAARRIVLAWCVFFGCLSASPALAQVGGYVLRVSTSPTRAGAVPLNGALVGGDVYIFVDPTTDIDDVEFYVDDPEQDDDYIQKEEVPPYDFAGTEIANGLAKPFHTHTLQDGVHTITVLIDRHKKSDVEFTATFTVSNPAVCGDGHVKSPTESCDDGNTVDDGNGCGGSCQRNDTCGDSVIQALFEECDATALGACAGPCEPDCTCPPPFDLFVSLSPDRADAVRLRGEWVAGDIYVFIHPEAGVDSVEFFLDDPDDEEREEGNPPFDLAGTNTADDTARPFDTTKLSDGWHTIFAEIEFEDDDEDDAHVSATFRVVNTPLCGDDFVHPLEECDDGSANSDTTPDACRTTCHRAACGDGVIDSGETCDEAGEAASCDLDCTPVSCGDGTTNTAVGEECDDAGESALCDPDCTAAQCGDGTTNATAGETCDGAGETATCDANCTAVACGDGTANVTAGEACDDGGDSAACDADCTLVACGDGTTNGIAGEACDDGGANSDSTPDACRTNCQAAGCGDDVIDAGEACDDGGETTSCDVDCTAAACGDGTTNMTAGETCDGAGETATCDADCTAAACGDGATNPTAGEACDGAGETATCDANCTAATCGDGTVNGSAGEACDGAGETATCDANCTAATCGDGTVNGSAGEACDGGGETAACDANCTAATCGDGTVNGSAGEACDGGGETAACDANCTAATCGDGTVNGSAGEACDGGAGNSDSTADACRMDCQAAGCGDGVVDTGEACDDGGETAACDANCTAAACGDGTTNATAGETCDGGGETAACDANCTAATCGDGTVNGSAGEACDDGAGNSDSTADACRMDCRAAGCGDGVVDTGEACDDGGETAACDANCTAAACGDGTTNVMAGETCDGGGETPGCDADCTAAACGDGTTNVTAGEVCDGGGETAACDTDCTAVICGDGTTNATAGEACDDGAGNSDSVADACRMDCQPAGCGDGVIDAGEACDDEGESAPCDADCTATACGDGTFNGSAGEACDDEGETATCDADCTAVACGDGTTNAAAGEACDGGGETAACDANCTAVACGDGTVNASAGEMCDDGAGNSDSTPGACRMNCQVAGCGDGVVDGGEACDDEGESATCDANCTAVDCGDGTMNATAGEACDGGGETATCDADCTAASCGDGTMNATAGEACDDGGETAVCDANCTAVACGDGTVNGSAGEMCDDGAGNSDSTPGACRLDCRTADCGDGAIDVGEACDDAGQSAACDADCTVAACGDGTLNTTAGETCDDAGLSASCDLDCTTAACGDGTTNAMAGEACDGDGESVACDVDCTVAACGDGTLNATAGETCDDAGLSASCDVDCTTAACGDGTTNAMAGEACDGGGESVACDVDCTVAACGDGTLNATAGETCDDAGLSASCDVDCTTAACGDGTTNAMAGEACDEGGESATCNQNCTPALCGDGLTNGSAGEECDGADQASCSGTCDADCTCTAGPHAVMVSISPDRSGSEPLHGMSVTGDVFVFLNSGLPITQALFYLDDDDQSGPPARIEGKVPYDFAGTKLDGTANPLHTTELADGAHSISVVVNSSDGGSAVIAATFFVGNDSAALAFTTSTMAFVLAESEGLASQTVDLNTTDGSVASYTASGSADWLEIAPGSGATPDTLTVLVDPTGQSPGIHTGSVTASAPGYITDVLTVSMQVGDPGDCAPVACSQILVDAPYVLTFDEDHDQIHDAAGIGTGFTYIDEPANGAGYIPGNLTMDTTAGVLAVTTTAGLQYQDLNALDNALGVGIDAPSHVTVLTTTLLSPPVGTGAFEQAGLWFGNDEDDHVKLVVLSTSVGTKIQFLLEVGGLALAEKKTGVLDLDGAAVALRLQIDPVSRSIQAAYQVDGGPIEIVTTFVVPPEFLSFDAAGIDPTIGTRSFGGVFASHRNGPAPLVYTFDDFAVDVEVFVPSTGDISFTRTSAPVFKPTSLAWAPDGRLYVTELLGTMHALTFGPDGELVDDEVIDALTDAVGPRLTLGLTIDPGSTPDGVTLWVSHSSPSLNNGTPNSGTVSRLSGPGFATVQHVITGLARAKANHSVNSIHFGPDGRLYIAAGGNTGAGAANQANTEFGEMAEQPLSAALLVADVFGAGFDGSCHNSANLFGPPPCDVVPYATGMRNMYDFVFHTNGSLYGPENGLGITGTYPPSPFAPCLGFGDPAPFNAMPPGHNPGEQPDLLLRILPGLYYGHPNPYRNECVFKDGSYQGVPAPPNWSPPLLVLGSNRSANAVIEYENDEEFCGALRGDLLISNFSVGDDLTRVRLSEDGLSVLDATSVVGGFDDPLPVAQDPDGTVYVGEFGTDQVTALVPVRSGCWTQVAGAPQAVLDASGAALDGKLYMVAGKTVAGPIPSVNVYDPQTDTWSGVADLPGAAVENPAVVGHGGKLYVFGGSTGPFSGAVTNAAAFDPESGWTSLASMPTARGGATAQVLGGLVYVVGGLDGSGASLETVDVYDPASNTWSAAASVATRRDNAASAVLDGKLYVFGGRTRDADGTEIDATLDSVEMYDPATDTWTDRASMPTGRRAAAVGTLNGRAQIIGGERTPEGGVFAQNEEYDPATDTWRPVASMLTPRHGTASATIGSVVYVAGGGPTGGLSLTNVNEAFLF